MTEYGIAGLPIEEFQPVVRYVCPYCNFPNTFTVPFRDITVQELVQATCTNCGQTAPVRAAHVEFP